MKIILINPNEMNPVIEYHPLEFRSTLLKYIGPPMTFPYLLSKIKKGDYEFVISDYFTEYLNANKTQDGSNGINLKKNVINNLKNADVVGISCMTSTQKYSFEYADLAKKINPSVKVVVGGPHTLIDQEFLISYQNIDFVIVGKGDSTFPSLLGCIKQKCTNIKKIWEDKSDYFENLFIPNYDIYFNNDFYNEIEVASIFTSKGCVESCKFCSRNHKIKKVEYKPIDITLRELKLFAEKGIKRVRFDDDNFFQNPEYSETIFEKMIENELNFELSVITRADTISSNLMDIYIKAGGKSAIVAIETGSENLRKKMGKRLSDKQIYDAVAILKDKGIFIYLFLMLGYPSETDEDLIKTEEMVDIINPDAVSCNIFHTHPGMPIYKKIKKEMLIPEDYFIKDGKRLNYFKGIELKKRIQLQEKLHTKYGFSVSGFWHQKHKYYSKA